MRLATVAGSEAGLQMPPTGPLSASDIGILRAWIDQGGDFPDVQIGEKEHPPEKPTDPKVQSFIDAVRRADADAVRKMLHADKTLATARDNGGASALMHAALLGGPDVMRLLLDAGADPNVRDDRQHATALGWAEFFGREDIAELIRDKGGVK